MKSKQTCIPVGKRYAVLCTEFCLCTIMLLVVIVAHVDAQFHQLHQSFGWPPDLLLLEYSDGDLGLSYIYNSILTRNSHGFYSEWHYSYATNSGASLFGTRFNTQVMPGVSTMVVNRPRKQGIVIVRGVRISFWYLDGIFFAWWLLYLSRFRHARTLRKLQRNSSSCVCVHCLYNLQGLDEQAACPECGAVQSHSTNHIQHDMIVEPDRVDPV
ncbi:MAG: hypothetical protein CMJ19_16780 [Phycisphaeraceae bacterium]|nr:hypothetical protein [Phycisphaeraceae bacterium]